MQLHVGQAALRGDIARYARRFDLLELRAEPGKLPRAKQLREWAKAVPENFVFSIMLPRVVGTLEPQPALDSALEQALSSADALAAGWLVLQTPASVRPNSRTRRRLAELFARLPRDTRRLAWEPRGIWEEDESEQLAAELGVCLVRDLSRQPPAAGSAAYCRLIALGEASRVRMGAVERVFENLAEFDEALVVIEGEGAVRAAQTLRQLAGELSAAIEDDEDDEDDGEDEEELDEDEDGDAEREETD
ncbi:MAG TPA: DUF72 domain-containing protein [Polyangiaceae bacterium]